MGLDWIGEALSLPFMLRALWAGMMVGGVCALIGVFVVQRGLSFIGDGLAHAAFGGIALGLWLGTKVEHAIWAALPFTLVVSLAIAYVLRKGRLRGDAVTGVFFSISFALGVLFLALSTGKGAVVQVDSLLFGSILAVGPYDLEITAVVCFVTVLCLLLTWSKLAYATFDAELAALSGVPVAALDYMLLGLTSVVIVIAVKTVGIALVSSFLIIPAVAARLVAKTLGKTTALSVAFGVGAVIVGLLGSYRLNVPSGATIILTLGMCFLLCFVIAQIRRKTS